MKQLTLKILRWQAGLDHEFAKYYWVEIGASALLIGGSSGAADFG